MKFFAKLGKCLQAAFRIKPTVVSEDPFEKGILRLPTQMRTIVSSSASGFYKGDCWFGVPANASYHFSTLEGVSTNSSGFYFLLGQGSSGLVEAFCSSGKCGVVKRLVIGASSYYNGEGLDYRAVVETLSLHSFPQLYQLELGAWVLFSNSHAMYGKLGNLSGLLGRCPSLQVLELNGHFDLTEKLNHKTLKALRIQIDDPVTAVNGGEISQSSLTNLLSGEMPNLEELDIDLSIFAPSITYSLPKSLFEGERLQSLRSLKLRGNFDPMLQAYIDSSPLARRVSISFEQTNEEQS